MIYGIVGSRHYGAILKRRDQDFRRFVVVADAVRGAMSSCTRIVSGGQRGIDTFAREYAQSLSIPFTEFHADAETGTATQRFHARDKKIALASSVLLALPCQHSRGTWVTVKFFQARGLRAHTLMVNCETGEIEFKYAAELAKWLAGHR